MGHKTRLSIYNFILLYSTFQNGQSYFSMNDIGIISLLNKLDYESLLYQNNLTTFDVEIIARVSIWATLDHHNLISFFLSTVFVFATFWKNCCPKCNLFNPFWNNPWFLRVYSTSFLKTLWEKEKLLVTSNFSFSHSVFYPFEELFFHFCQI